MRAKWAITAKYGEEQTNNNLGLKYNVQRHPLPSHIFNTCLRLKQKKGNRSNSLTNEQKGQIRTNIFFITRVLKQSRIYWQREDLFEKLDREIYESKSIERIRFYNTKRLTRKWNHLSTEPQIISCGNKVIGRLVIEIQNQNN